MNEDSQNINPSKIYTHKNDGSYIIAERLSARHIIVTLFSHRVYIVHTYIITVEYQKLPKLWEPLSL